MARQHESILSRRMPIDSCLLHDGCYIHALTMHSSSDCSPCACVPVALFPALFANVSQPILSFCDTNSVLLYKGIKHPNYRMLMRIRSISFSLSVLALYLSMQLLKQQTLDAPLDTRNTVQAINPSLVSPLHCNKTVNRSPSSLAPHQGRPPASSLG